MNKEEILEDWGELAVPMELYPKSYRVSKEGNVFRWEKKFLKWVKCETFKFQGGLSVKIDKNWWSLAEQVANHFVPNPLNFGTVGFKNGDCYDCSADNLFWCDNSTSGTFREGAVGDFMCFDVRQNHIGIIRTGEKKLFIYPSDYEFMPEIGKDYQICYSTRCLKLGLDKEMLGKNRDRGIIKFTKVRDIKIYDEIDLDEAEENGIIDVVNREGKWYSTVNSGRVFYGDNSINDAIDNLFMSMFGRIPEKVSILEFKYTENDNEI